MSAPYINPALPSMIRGLYEADLRPKSIRDMLDLAADLVQDLIDLREQADREPSDEEVEAGAKAILQEGLRLRPPGVGGQVVPYVTDEHRALARVALTAAQGVRREADHV